MEEKRFKEIDAKIDAMDDIDKDFALWCLLRWKMDNLKVNTEPQNKQEFITSVLTRDIRYGMENLIEIIGYDLWG